MAEQPPDSTCTCPRVFRDPDIETLAEEHDFTYDEALDYVIHIGLAYARRPPLTAPEPGA